MSKTTDPETVLGRYPKTGWRDLYPFEPRRFVLPRPPRAVPGDDADGVAMNHLDEGPRDARPIVMVHGNPTWSFYFREPVAALRG